MLSLDVPDDDAATFEHSLLLEPAKYSADEFVNALKDIALAHPASKHPFLEDIARGRFPSFTKVLAGAYRKVCQIGLLRGHERTLPISSMTHFIYLIPYQGDAHVRDRVLGVFIELHQAAAGLLGEVW